MIPLSDQTLIRLKLLFPPELQPEAIRLLEEQCNPGQLPFNPDSLSLDRIRFAALKISSGDMSKLRAAIDLAQQDWRDLLMAAGFGEDESAYEDWMPF